MLRVVRKAPRLLLRSRELSAALRFMRNQTVLSTREHLGLTADGLLAADRHSPDGGYSMLYSLNLGWAPGYVETTGYIIPTALELAASVGRQDLRRNALTQGEWLLSRQFENGSFPDASRERAEIFDTGQVLLGLQRLYSETAEDRYREAGSRAARWLSEQITAPMDNAQKPIPSYNTRSAAATIDFGCLTGNDSLVESGRSFLRGVLDRKLASGLFQYSQLGTDTDFLLHTIVYVLEGFLHAHAVLGETVWLEAAMAGAEPLKRICVEREIVPYSFYDARLNPTTRERCITGLAQWAGICLRLYELTGDEAYRDCGSNALYYVKSKQIQWPGQLRGALPGSVPFWGRYLRMSFPNWNLKFFGDALLKWSALGLDDGLHQETFVRCAHAIGSDRIGWTDTAAVISDFDVRLLRCLDKILAPLAQKKSGSIAILDLGCSEGRFVRRLAAEHPGWDVSGIDPVVPTSKDIRIDLGSATHIPRADASTDAIYAFIALQHVDNIPAALSEVSRVLKPGGIFVVFDRNPRSLRGLLKPWHEFKGRWLYEWDAPFRERWYTRSAWSRMLRRAGFKLVTCQTMTHFGGAGLRRILPINRFVLIAGKKQK
jgi:ubiquinone/menaquinone biosynthesis C-methylase UbiE